MNTSDLVKCIDNYPYPTEWGRRILSLKPKNVVELGTGQGATGVAIMEVLPFGSKFTTINYDYPDNCKFGELLNPYKGDPRLTMLVADTTKVVTLQLVQDGIDLLYVDTHHFAWQAALELFMWQTKLVNGAVVIYDDLDHNDMMAFWNTVPYDKVVRGNQGIFAFYTDKVYTGSFGIGRTPKELALDPR